MRTLVAHPSPTVATGLAVALAQDFGLATTSAVTLPSLRRLVLELRPELAVVDLELAPGGEVDLCMSLVRQGVRPVLVTRAGSAGHLELLERGAAGIVVSSDGLTGVRDAVRTVLEGHVHLPAHLLGSVLHDLILERREQAAPTTNRLVALSPREREVLGLLGHGADTREIASRLVISPHTAKTHINRVLAKLGLASRSEAAGFAVAHGVEPTLLEATHD